MKFGFGKRLKPRQFDYIPRFYDEQKEDLEKRISKFEGETSSEEKVKARIKAGMRQNFHGNATFRSQQTRQSNLRLVYIIGILCLITYFVLKSDRISRIIESFSS